MSIISEINDSIIALKAETENNAITPDALGTILQKMASLLNKYMLPFHGILEDATVSIASTAASLPQIYYIRAKNCFAAYVNGAFYANWGDDGTPFCRSAYNSGSAFSGFTAITTNHYRYIEGNIYTFINNTLTLTYKGDVKFTSLPFVNQAVKELYLTSSSGIELDTCELYINVLIQKSGAAVRCQLTIYGNYGNSVTCVTSYNDDIIDDGHRPPSLIPLNAQIGSGISGYAVIDWSVVKESIDWYVSSSMGKAFITYKAFDPVFSPTIYAKMKLDGEI